MVKSRKSGSRCAKYQSYQGQQAHHLRINQPSLLCDMPPVQRVLHWRVQNIKSKDEPTSEPLKPWQHNGTSTQSQPTPEDLCRWSLLGVPISRRQYQPPNYTWSLREALPKNPPSNPPLKSSRKEESAASQFSAESQKFARANSSTILVACQRDLSTCRLAEVLKDEEQPKETESLTNTTWKAFDSSSHFNFVYSTLILCTTTTKLSRLHSKRNCSCESN